MVVIDRFYCISQILHLYLYLLFSCSLTDYYGISMFNGTRSVAIGGTIKLICRAKVNPFVRTHAMIVRKASSNTRGTFATKFKSLTSHTYTRTIKNARMDDSGTYQCFIFSLRIGVTVTRELEVVVGDHL